ncbi:DUF6745 domain-containing protein [Actinoplanes sp. NPDC026670]|uniref:DUF6745 domain-containing protein n=1 Tax=Actinoplanes sp. NPDC026670 TaxID=3154700 RepID=UPI0034051879
MAQPSEVPVAGPARGWAGTFSGAGVFGEAERATVADALRHCYGHAGLRWPGRLVWAASPLQGRALAADLTRRHTGLRGRVTAVFEYFRRAAPAIVVAVLTYGLPVAVFCAGSAWMLPKILMGEPLRSAGHALSVDPAAWRGAWIGGVAFCLLAVPIIVWNVYATEPFLSDEDGIWEILWALVVGLLAGLAAFLLAGLWIAVGSGIGAALRLGGADPPSTTWTTTLLVCTLVPAVLVSAAVGVLVRWRRNPPLPLRFGDPAYRTLSSVDIAAGRAVPRQQRPPAWQALGSVEDTIGQVVGWSSPPRPGRYQVEHFASGAGDVTAGPVQPSDNGMHDDDAVAVARDFAAASRAGWWWPHTEFVVVTEPPVTFRAEWTGPQGDPQAAGGWRLHSTDGPAAEWPDGFRVYAWHGDAVPAAVIEKDGEVPDGPHRTVRAAIALIGWNSYIRRARWRLVGRAEDPADPQSLLALYEDPGCRRRGKSVPARRLRGVRVLVRSTSGRDPDADMFRVAEPVPEAIGDPVEAAAWQYGCPADIYRRPRNEADRAAAGCPLAGSSENGPPMLAGPQILAGLLILSQPCPDLPEAAWQPLGSQGVELGGDDQEVTTHRLYPGIDSPGVWWAAPVANIGQTLIHLDISPGQSVNLVRAGENTTHAIGPGSWRINGKRDYELPFTLQQPG